MCTLGREVKPAAKQTCARRPTRSKASTRISRLARPSTARQDAAPTIPSGRRPPVHAVSPQAPGLPSHAREQARLDEEGPLLWCYAGFSVQLTEGATPSPVHRRAEERLACFVHPRVRGGLTLASTLAQTGAKERSRGDPAAWTAPRASTLVGWPLPCSRRMQRCGSASASGERICDLQRTHPRAFLAPRAAFGRQALARHVAPGSARCRHAAP
jgi:hypothetical protein